MSERRTYSQERINLANAYPGKKWAQKVMNMSDDQVHAAWVSIRNRKEKEGKKVG